MEFGPNVILCCLAQCWKILEKAEAGSRRPHRAIGTHKPIELRKLGISEVISRSL